MAMRSSAPFVLMYAIILSLNGYANHLSRLVFDCVLANIVCVPTCSSKSMPRLLSDIYCCTCSHASTLGDQAVLRICYQRGSEKATCTRYSSESSSESSSGIVPKASRSSFVVMLHNHLSRVDVELPLRDVYDAPVKPVSFWFIRIYSFTISPSSSDGFSTWCDSGETP